MTTDSNESQGRKKNPDEILSKALVQQGTGASLDISLLTDEEQRELTMAFQKDLIDVRIRAADLNVSVEALGATLRNLSDNTSYVAQSGNSVTISHTQESSAGKTEIIMGNTDRAQSGRLSRFQTGDIDWTPYLIGGGIVGVVVIVLAALAR